MSARFHFLTLCAAAAFLCSCATDQDQRVADEYDKLLQQSTRFLAQLREQNQLPGVAKDEHGNLQVHAEGITDAQGHFLKQKITFPVTFTAYWTRSAGSDELSYKVTKDNEQSNWRLDGAWRKDKNQGWTTLK